MKVPPKKQANIIVANHTHGIARSVLRFIAFTQVAESLERIETKGEVACVTAAACSFSKSNVNVATGSHPSALPPMMIWPVSGLISGGVMPVN